MSAMTSVGFRPLIADYVGERLARGKELSRLLLREWDFTHGDIQTTLDESLGIGASLDFRHGGKLSEAKARGLEDPRQTLVEFIASRFAEEDRATLIVEDELRVKSDQVLTRLPGRRSYYHDDVYWLLPAWEATSQAIRDILLNSFALYLNVMILVDQTFHPHLPDENGPIEAAALRSAAQSASTLIVGAYDEEAHIVWMHSNTKHSRNE